MNTSVKALGPLLSIRGVIRRIVKLSGVLSSTTSIQDSDSRRKNRAQMNVNPGTIVELHGLFCPNPFSGSNTGRLQSAPDQKYHNQLILLHNDMARGTHSGQKHYKYNHIYNYRQRRRAFREIRGMHHHVWDPIVVDCQLHPWRVPFSRNATGGGLNDRPP